MWMGIDGWNQGATATVEQAGVIAFCKTRKSTAQYNAFYEMFQQRYPGQTGPRYEPRTSVHAGDKIATYVSVSHGRYTFVLSDTTDHKGFMVTVKCQRKTTATPHPAKCLNAMAEVITEAVGGGPDAGHSVADMGRVRYTNTAVGVSSQINYGFDFGELKMVKINMSPKGHARLVTPGKFSGKTGPSNFSTFWRN
jgi:Peptidase A4 family